MGTGRVWSQAGHMLAAENSRRLGSAQSRQWLSGMVRVLDSDPDLTDGLDPGSASAARAHAVAPRLSLTCGGWTPPSGERCRNSLGLLVLDGLLTRCLSTNGVLCPELIGQGDLLRPWDEPTDADRADVAKWRVLQPTTMAVLDSRFYETIRRWPRITDALLSRAILRSRWLARQTALPQIRRADDRLRLLFGDLAARWGRVTRLGVLVPLPLTNQLLGELACLRRPTVSTTMKRLAQTGEITRVSTGFLLQLEAPTLEEPTGVAA